MKIQHSHLFGRMVLVEFNFFTRLKNMPTVTDFQPNFSQDLAVLVLVWPLGSRGFNFKQNLAIVNVIFYKVIPWTAPVGVFYGANVVFLSEESSIMLERYNWTFTCPIKIFELLVRWAVYEPIEIWRSNILEILSHVIKRTLKVSAIKRILKVSAIQLCTDSSLFQKLPDSFVKFKVLVAPLWDIPLDLIWWQQCLILWIFDINHRFDWILVQKLSNLFAWLLAIFSIVAID